MKPFIVVLSLISLLFVSCSKNEEVVVKDPCTANILKEFDMIPYTGQTNYCNSLSEYEFESKRFFVFDCCICDMAPNPVDCENVSYVIVDGKYDESKALYFFSKAKNLGIVGVYAK